MAIPNAPIPVPRLTGVVWHGEDALAGAGSRSTLMMLVHHTDAEREYAYRPAGGLPNTGIGVFTDAPLQATLPRKRGFPRPNNHP